MVFNGDDKVPIIKTSYRLSGQGVDQLQNIIDLIKKEPNSRRIIMNAWNPYDLDKMALRPVM